MRFCLEMIKTSKRTDFHFSLLFAFGSCNKWISIDHEIKKTIAELIFSNFIAYFQKILLENALLIRNRQNSKVHGFSFFR